MKWKKTRTAMRLDGRFLSNLGAGTAMFAGCGVVSLLVALATGSQVVVPVVMGCGPVAAVVLTKSAAHGVLIAAMSSGVSAWALMNTIRLPSVVFLLLLAAYTGLVLLVRIPLRALEDDLDEMRKKHRQEKLINDINQRILASRANDSLDLLTLESLCELTGKPGVIYRRTETGIESACLIPRWQIVYPTELSAAEKAFATGQRCGLSTEYFSSSSYLYIPIIAQNKILAVAAIRFGVGNPPDEEMATAIDLIIRQCALAMTRKDLVEEQHKIVMQSEKEKIRNDFLRAISHDLRTPLAGIISACSTMEESREQLSAQAQAELVQDIHTEAEWLLRMVENLLSVTRVTGGANMLKKDLEPVDEIIWGAAERIRLRYPESTVVVNTPEEVLLAEMDGTLIVQVLTNLMENAIKYSDSTEPVEISVRPEEGFALFEVRDHGKGLDQEALANLFTATTIRSHAGGNGLGIGLSICRTIVEAHGGTISGRNEPSGGASFCFTLPLEELS